MVSANECVLSGYFGCRQQCLYGCFFLFIDICFVSWGSCQHAWYRLGKSCGFGWWVHWIERKIRQGGLASEYATRKPIVNCIFDIVNTKNLSGGMIGPGNCQWLHNTIVFKWCHWPWNVKVVKKSCCCTQCMWFRVNPYRY